MACYVPP
ncbi:unnamed protein product, partial [Didymodactylos carnosus]